MIAALLWAPLVFAAPGDRISDYDFDLSAGNTAISAITWDGAYFRVVDHVDGKVYAYTSTGVYTASENFTLTAANRNPVAITWDGAYFRVVDHVDSEWWTT